MHEIRCPSCGLRLWLHQGMGRDAPLPRECPQCHLASPIDPAARLGARIASEHRVASNARQAAVDSPRRPRVGPGTTW